jgi:hypothetical protein
VNDVLAAMLAAAPLGDAVFALTLYIPAAERLFNL